MSVKIELRKLAARGGYLMKPLRRNIPDPKNKEWKLTRCPICGAECWKSPLPEGYNENMFAGRLCTMCALKQGISAQK